MSKLVARMEKFNKNNLNGLGRHDQRRNKSYKNPEIDLNRTEQNIDLINGENRISFSKEIERKIQENKTSKRKVSKNSVLLCEWIISSDQEYFEGKSREEILDYFQTAVNYFKEKYGEKNIAYGIVHLDETTPHMHMGIVPITEDGRLSAKECFNRKALLEIQNDLPKYLQARGHKVERGEKGSKRKHLTTEEFKDVQREKERLEARSKEVKNELNELIEWTEKQDKKVELLREQKENLREEIEELEEYKQEISGQIGNTIERFEEVKTTMNEIDELGKDMPFGKTIIETDKFEDLKIMAKQGEYYTLWKEELEEREESIEKEEKQIESQKERLKIKGKSILEEEKKIEQIKDTEKDLRIQIYNLEKRLKESEYYRQNLKKAYDKQEKDIAVYENTLNNISEKVMAIGYVLNQVINIKQQTLESPIIRTLIHVIQSIKSILTDLGKERLIMDIEKEKMSVLECDNPGQKHLNLNLIDSLELRRREPKQKKRTHSLER